jgi:hypothetical protein
MTSEINIILGAMYFIMDTSYVIFFAHIYYYRTPKRINPQLKKIKNILLQCLEAQCPDATCVGCLISARHQSRPYKITPLYLHSIKFRRVTP